MRHRRYFLKKHSSTLLTIIGAAGLIGTAVLTAKGTIKAMDVLKSMEQEETSKKDKIIAVIPAYLPAFSVGCASIVCIFGANTLNKRAQASLVSAYTLLDQSYREFKTKTNDIYGKETSNRIEKEIIKDRKFEIDGVHKKDEVLFFEEFSGEYFWRTIEEVQQAEYHFNRNLALRGYADLNELYTFLRLDDTELGAYLGWSLGAGAEFYGYSWVDFNHELIESDDPDAPPYYYIRMPFPPTADYMDY